MADLKGLGNVTKNLNREINKLENRSLKGLIRGGIIIIRGTEKESPKVPVDEGNLRASRFLVTSKGDNPEGASPVFRGENARELSAEHNSLIGESKSRATQSRMPGVILGFSANYAFLVHEMVGANFKRLGSGAKFLEASLKRNSNKVLTIIAEEARIK